MTDKLPSLRTSLLDLLWELRGKDVPLILGGGYGIFLKAEHVRTHSLRTLLREWPESRSTNDLDLFLRSELLLTPGRLAPLAQAIKHLGYSVIPTAKNYQFIKGGPEGDAGEVKIDLLTGPQSLFQGSTAKSDGRRVRPVPSIGLHAHPVDEAFSLEEGLLALTLSGTRTTGKIWSGELFLPHPFTYLMMKLFAFRDRLNDASKEYGRYHALDLYSIIATTTEEEWNAFPAFRSRFQKAPLFDAAVKIISEQFSGRTALGVLRIRESRYFRPELQIDDFISILKESFTQG